MITDVVIVVAMKYVEKGVVAQAKLQQIEEQHHAEHVKLDKGEKLAQKQAARHPRPNRTAPEKCDFFETFDQSDVWYLYN